MNRIDKKTKSMYNDVTSALHDIMDCKSGWDHGTSGIRKMISEISDEDLNALEQVRSILRKIEHQSETLGEDMDWYLDKEAKRSLRRDN